MCEKAADCQDNARCWLNEKKLQDTGEIENLCHCDLGFLTVINGTPDDIYPKTGTCVDLRTNGCKYPNACLEDENKWGVCPYCRAYKDHDDHGGQLSTGNYVGGSGTTRFDGMEFTGGSSTNCFPAAERSSTAFWYCWNVLGEGYTDLDNYKIFWLEDPTCHYNAYIYTPLACA